MSSDDTAAQQRAVLLRDVAQTTGGIMPSVAEHVALVASCGVRIIRALAWSGASVEPAAAGRICW